MMNSLFKLIAGICIFLSALFFSACKNSYDNMIEEYNEKYFVKSYLPPEPYTTSSKNFNEIDMLDDIISMQDGNRMILSAPEGGEGCTYKWEGFAPGKDSEGKDCMKSIFVETERTLFFDAPGGFDKDRENKLVVTVTEKSGKQYTDTARVFIEIE